MIGLGLGLGLSAHSSAVSYSAEAMAYFAAMSVQPDATRKGQLDTLIAALKTAGVYTKLDWLSIMAAHDEQAGRINIKNPAQLATAVNAPTFLADRGFTGNGTTSYLDTGWNPTTATTPNFAQNSCHMGVWVGTNVLGASMMDIGNTYTRLNTRLFTSVPTMRSARQQSSTNDATIAATSIGHSMWNRTASANTEAFRDAASVGTATTASSALRNATFMIGAYNNSSTGTATPTEYSTRRIQAAHWGSQLSGAEVTALYNALATYMTAVGA